MSKRTKKAAVSMETARQWLKRNEKNGETPPTIAGKDGYDVRTVRKQMERARQDYEVRHATQAVLRNAIEAHYRDICTFAEKLKAVFSAEDPQSISPDLQKDPFWNALSEHLRKTRLKSNIEKWQDLAPRYSEVESNLKGRIRKEAVERSSLEYITETDMPGLISDGFDDAILQHLCGVASGRPGLADIGFTIKPEGDYVWIGRGGYGLAMVPDGRVVEIQELFNKLMKESLAWEEYTELEKTIRVFKRVQENIQDELTAVILKRIVPGKCRYCPF